MKIATLRIRVRIRIRIRIRMMARIRMKQNDEEGCLDVLASRKVGGSAEQAGIDELSLSKWQVNLLQRLLNLAEKFNHRQ